MFSAGSSAITETGQAVTPALYHYRMGGGGGGGGEAALPKTYSNDLSDFSIFSFYRQFFAFIRWYSQG